MKLQEWNQMQKDEALGSVNRYYFHLFYGRDAINDDELFMYYVENGGAKSFREKHKKERNWNEEKKTT